jgi:hypothetical protein
VSGKSCSRKLQTDSNERDKRSKRVTSSVMRIQL